jgi:hypothetical protein
MWRSLKSDPAQGETLTSYLRAYRQQPIELKYIKKTYSSKLPLLSIMAFSQAKRLFDVLAPEDYSTGFVRRHIFIFSPTVRLQASDQHRYDPQFIAKNLRKSGVMQVWQKHTERTPIHLDYNFDQASDRYIRANILSASIDLNLELGYAVTALYTARKFALIYHWLLGERNQQIGRRAAEFAVALTLLTLHDLRYLMDEGQRSKLSQLIEDGLEIRRKIEAKTMKGPFDHRKLQQNLHIDNAMTARFVFDVVSQISLSEQHDSCPNLVEFQSTTLSSEGGSAGTL